MFSRAEITAVAMVIDADGKRDDDANVDGRDGDGKDAGEGDSGDDADGAGYML